MRIASRRHSWMPGRLATSTRNSAPLPSTVCRNSSLNGTGPGAAERKVYFASQVRFRGTWEMPGWTARTDNGVAMSPPFIENHHSSKKNPARS